MIKNYQNKASKRKDRAFNDRMRGYKGTSRGRRRKQYERAIDLNIGIILELVIKC